MRYFNWCFTFLVTCFILSCQTEKSEKKTVLAIPVYGQSLALGEEAIRITDFDSLTKQTNHHVLTENLDEEFGYLSETHFKQWMKKILHDRHRAFELSIYGMSEMVSKYLYAKGNGDSLIISIFPGGRGATGISDLGKGSDAYKKFLDEIETAYNKAQRRGWNFVVPAFCWMQGEDDIVWRKSPDYKRDLETFQADLNRDIKSITKQTKDVKCICYQTNCLTLSKQFKAVNYHIRETYVPQGQMELIRDNEMFMASGPTYPYSFEGERVHIDGVSQKRLGNMAGLAVIRLLESKPGKGLIPEHFTISGDTVLVKFNVPSPPLVLDTVSVWKADNFGFTVVDSGNTNIIQELILENDIIKLCCKKSPKGCKVRYAVNGKPGKSGYKFGPRGNLRDSQGIEQKVDILKKVYPLHNWCYQFDMIVN